MHITNLQYPFCIIAQGSLHSLADLFSRTPSQLVLEASDHTAVNMHKLFIHNYPPLPKARYSFIQLSEL